MIFDLSSDNKPTLCFASIQDPTPMVSKNNHREKLGNSNELLKKPYLE